MCSGKIEKRKKWIYVDWGYEKGNKENEDKQIDRSQVIDNSHSL